MNSRANPFADVADLPAFEPKPKIPAPSAAPPLAIRVDEVAEANGFPSRQASRSSPKKRVGRRYKTGRNQQINIKATSEVIERLYKVADQKRVPLGELLAQALDALEKNDNSR